MNEKQSDSFCLQTITDVNRFTTFIILIFCCFFTKAQTGHDSLYFTKNNVIPDVSSNPDTIQNRHVSLGSANYGICFGNAANYNGIRFNLLDKNVNNINGLNISVVHSRVNDLNGINVGAVALWDTLAICNRINVGGVVSSVQKSNGINIGGLGAIVKKSNGINIGGLGAMADRQNGIAASLLFTEAKNKLNGIGFGWCSVAGDTLNGFSFGGFCVGYSDDDGNANIKLINGFGCGGFRVWANKVNGTAVSITHNIVDTLHGVTISAINVCKQLHGFEFGFINYAGNNKRLFRYTPFFNFNLRKKSDR